jgi:predicted phosphodiesterase
LGTAGAGLAAYLLRERPTSLRLLAAGAAFGVPWVAHAALAKPSCVFLYVTDTHGSAEANQRLVQAMLEERDVSFVAHGGDVADEPRFWSVWWDELFAPVRERWPVYAASGNHDLATDENAAEFEERFGDLPRHVRCGDAELFFLPWGMTRATSSWLQAAVEASTASVRILVVHKPVWPMRDDDARQRALIEPVLDRIDLVLAGHEHAFQDRTHEGVRQIIEISGPKSYRCVAGARGCLADSRGYLRVEVYEDSFRVYRRAV